MRPWAKASTMLSPLAIRADPAALVTTVGRSLPALLESGPMALKLTRPFSEVIDGVITDPVSLGAAAGWPSSRHCSTRGANRRMGRGVHLAG